MRFPLVLRFFAGNIPGVGGSSTTARAAGLRTLFSPLCYRRTGLAIVAPQATPRASNIHKACCWCIVNPRMIRGNCCPASQSHAEVPGASMKKHRARLFDMECRQRSCHCLTTFKGPLTLTLKRISRQEDQRRRTLGYIQKHGCMVPPKRKPQHVRCRYVCGSRLTVCAKIAAMYAVLAIDATPHCTVLNLVWPVRSA